MLSPAGTEVTIDAEGLRIGITDCKAASFSAGGVDSCTSCPLNSFSGPKAVNCAPCPQYQKATGDIDNPCECETSFFKHASDSLKCTCSKGNMLMGASCEVCEIGRFKDFDGIDSCKLCDKMIKGSTTRKDNSISVHDCICPKGTFLSANGIICEKIVNGVEENEEGMSLEFLYLKAGFWRTNSNSTDIRDCPVEAACIGGNHTTSYCRTGHGGPYCNLCDEGYSKDVFGLCQECQTSTTSLVVSIATMIALGVGFIIAYILWNRFAKKNRKMSKKMMGGLKILIVTYQIIAGLPAIIPAISLPSNFKTLISSMQFFNLNVFQFISVGCFSSGFNFFSMLLATTITPGSFILVLLGTARFMLERNSGKSKKGLISAALATSYLVLPTVTTTIFAAFPCDTFDDGTSYLRGDYDMSCHSNTYKFMTFYAGVMLLLYPVGILTLYSKILINNKELIKKTVEEREDDSELMSKGFLFENYKPACWWFEIAETVRRLLLTSVLGFIEPGTDSQLAVGIVISVGGICLSCTFMPYLEKRDNLLSILSSTQIFVIVLIALVMKKRNGSVKVEGETDSFDDKYLGYVLFALFFLLIAVFLLSGFVSQFVRRSRRREAGGESGGGGARERTSTGLYDIFSGLRESLGWRKDKPLAIDDDQSGLELGNIYSGGEDGSRNSDNPMSVERPSSKSFTNPTTSLPSHLAKFTPGDFRPAAAMKGGGRKRGDSTKAESSKKAVEIKEIVDTDEKGGSRWTSVYDETQKSHYYFDNNTHETTWEKPDDFEE